MSDWKIQHRDDDEVSMLDCEEGAVADVYGSDREQRKSRAALIAAAPDMLAELTTLAKVFRGLAEHYSKRSSHSEKALTNLSHAQRIDALIKKASPQ